MKETSETELVEIVCCFFLYKSDCESMKFMTKIVKNY